MAHLSACNAQAGPRKMNNMVGRGARGTARLSSFVKRGSCAASCEMRFTRRASRGDASRRAPIFNAVNALCRCPPHPHPLPRQAGARDVPECSTHTRSETAYFIISSPSQCFSMLDRARRWRYPVNPGIVRRKNLQGDPRRTCGKEGGKAEQRPDPMWSFFAIISQLTCLEVLPWRFLTNAIPRLRGH